MQVCFLNRVFLFRYLYPRSTRKLNNNRPTPHLAFTYHLVATRGYPSRHSHLVLQRSSKIIPDHSSNFNSSSSILVRVTAPIHHMAHTVTAPLQHGVVGPEHQDLKTRTDVNGRARVVRMVVVKKANGVVVGSTADVVEEDGEAADVEAVHQVAGVVAEALVEVDRRVEHRGQQMNDTRDQGRVHYLVSARAHRGDASMAQTGEVDLSDHTARLEDHRTLQPRVL